MRVVVASSGMTTSIPSQIEVALSGLEQQCKEFASLVVGDIDTFAEKVRQDSKPYISVYSVAEQQFLKAAVGCVVGILAHFF